MSFVVQKDQTAYAQFRGRGRGGFFCRVRCGKQGGKFRWASGKANSVSNSLPPSCREEARVRELRVLGISDPRLGVASAWCSHHLCVCLDLDRV